MLEFDIRKQFESFALDIHLDAPRGKIIVLFGPSGSGKSLTLAAIAGWLTPDRGRIAIEDSVLFDAELGINLEPQARRIGMVRQDLTLFPHLTAAENIGYGLWRTPAAEREARVRSLLALVQLEGMGERKPSELSGGQQQRVALARALAIEPNLLLLDEPFSALDAPTRIDLRDELKGLQKRLETNTLFVTHDLGEANLLADKLAIVENGRVVQFAEPEVISRAPSSKRVAEIVGVKNILPATRIAADCVRVGECELEIEPTSFDPYARLFVCLRPERITLVRREGPTKILSNLFEGDLLEEQSDGSNVTLQFRTTGARMQPAQPFDLLIDVPQYVYERLNLARERHWHISIKPGVMHLVPE